MEMLKCAHCGCEFPKTPKHVNKVFCSSACRVKAQWAREKALKLHTVICLTCGKEFQTTKNQQIYCSHRCCAGYYAQDKTKTCKWCGKEFSIDSGRRIFCSDECRSHYHSAELCAKRKGEDVIVTPASRKKRKPKIETLQQAAANANKMGLTYGQYMVWKQQRGY